jgi:Mg2+ and Co2+ transporter CorA
MHRLMDRMVDHYGPEADSLEERLEKIEQKVFTNGR